MSVDTIVDWKAIGNEIKTIFGIPGDLEKYGISAIRVLIIRRHGEELTTLLSISHGVVGLVDDAIYDDFISDCYTNIGREQIVPLVRDDIPAARGLVTRELLGDVVLIEYLVLEGLEDKALELTGPMLTLVGSYANRNP